MDENTSLIMGDQPAPFPAQVEDKLSLSYMAQIADRAAAETEISRYQARRSAETLRRQRADLALFARYLLIAQQQDASDEQSLAHALYTDSTAWSGMSHGLVQGFIAWQLSEGYSTGSIGVRLATVKRYCELASRAGAIPAEVYTLIKTVRGYSSSEARNLDEQRAAAGMRTRREKSKKAEPIFLSRVHVEKLKQQPDTAKGRRDRLIMCLLLDHGLRVAEIAGLNRSSIDLSAGTFTVYRHKVNITQTHELSPDTYDAARAYLGLFSMPPEQGDEPLFTRSLPLKRRDQDASESVKRARQRINTRTLFERINRLSERAIGIRIAPHDGRHTWADGAIKAGTSIVALTDAGGWSNIERANKYRKRAKIANQGIELPWSKKGQ